MLTDGRYRLCVAAPHGGEYQIESGFSQWGVGYRDVAAEALFRVTSGDEEIGQALVGITRPALLGLRFLGAPALDPFDVPMPVWQRMILRLGFGKIAAHALAGPLTDKYYDLEQDEIQDFLDQYGLEGRPCEYLDMTSTLTRRCTIATGHGVQLPITQAICNVCRLPEAFERCRDLSVIGVDDTSHLGAQALTMRLACGKGHELGDPHACRTRQCYEPWRIESAQAPISAATLAMFERMVREVDSQLGSRFPHAFAELNAAYARLAPEASSHELSQAANSCRRVLRDLADALFPGQSEQYKDRGAN